MGIKQLSKLLADVVPEAIKEQEIPSYFGRRIAIDASTSLYQFLVAIRLRADIMVNGSGEDTSHLIGFFHRTNKLLEVSKDLFSYAVPSIRVTNSKRVTEWNQTYLCIRWQTA